MMQLTAGAGLTQVLRERPRGRGMEKTWQNGATATLVFRMNAGWSGAACSAASGHASARFTSGKTQKRSARTT